MKDLHKLCHKLKEEHFLQMYVLGAHNGPPPPQHTSTNHTFAPDTFDRS